MKKRVIKYHMDGLIALLLFGVFAISILAVLLTGAGAYRRLTERDQATYDHRTAMQYIATRVRQADKLGALTVEKFEGTTCLSLAELINGEVYVTRVYYYDGYIRELFAAKEADMSPEDGELVMAANELSLDFTDGLLTITAVSADGTENILLLSPRSGEGAVS